MTEYVTGGSVENGKLKIRNVQQFQDAIKHFRPGEVFVTVERAHARASELQRRYYFGLVLKMFAEETGHTVKELHEWAKTRFIPHEIAICDGNGEVIDGVIVGGTITKLNRLTFADFIESVRLFMAEKLGIVTPDPDPAWKEERAKANVAKLERGRRWAQERAEKSREDHARD